MMNWNMRTCKTDDCLITAQLHIWPESTRTRVHVKLRPHVLSEAASWWGLDAATWSRTSWYGRSTRRAVNAVNMESSSFYKFAAELRVWQNCAHTHAHTHTHTHSLPFTSPLLLQRNKLSFFLKFPQVKPWSRLSPHLFIQIDSVFV